MRLHPRGHGLPAISPRNRRHSGAAIPQLENSVPNFRPDFHLSLLVGLRQVPSVLDPGMGRRFLALGPLALHPHGHPQQDLIRARRHPVDLVLLARGHRRLGADHQGHEVLQVPKVAGQLAENEEAAGLVDAVQRRFARLHLGRRSLARVQRHRLRQPQEDRGRRRGGQLEPPGQGGGRPAEGKYSTLCLIMPRIIHSQPLITATLA